MLERTQILATVSPYTYSIVGEPVVDATSSVEMPSQHHSSTNSFYFQNKCLAAGPLSPTSPSLQGNLMTHLVVTSIKWVYQPMYFLQPYNFSTLSQRLSTGRHDSPTWYVISSPTKSYLGMPRQKFVVVTQAYTDQRRMAYWVILGIIIRNKLMFHKMIFCLNYFDVILFLISIFLVV